ncbi:microtubule-associated protein 1 light chain 3 gamma [Pyxicephalus adspersus]|uniref:microtubule-associated protein 1 light chain 3 gamma n=1 Tax=Pyxicephalus adspersus TaxID=30357 RepID=UPI003B5C2A2B
MKPMHPPRNASRSKPFKQRKSLETRKTEAIGMKAKYPTKIPVIVERYAKEKYLPRLDKTKFLVPQDITMSQFVSIIRDRMHLSATHALYVLVKGKTLPSMTLTMTELYEDQKDEDGFLYMIYASQEMFGGLGA